MTGSDGEASDPLDELSRENAVIQRLDERLAELATSLRNGARIAPGEVAEGLRLYEQYVRVHARRFDEGLQPEARPVAMPTCFEHLDTIRRDRDELVERISRARRALELYARGDDPGRLQLGNELEAFAQHEYAGIRYENDYPLSCLRATLPDDAAQRVRDGFERTGNEVGDLDRHIEEYLRHEPGKVVTRFAVRCAHPGCVQKSEAESYPDEHGHVGIRGPKGWRVVPCPPRVSNDEGKLVVVDIDFWCPDHRGPPDATEKATAKNGEPRDPASSSAASATEPTTCSCCDAIPPSLA